MKRSTPILLVALSALALGTSPALAQTRGTGRFKVRRDHPVHWHTRAVMPSGRINWMVLIDGEDTPLYRQHGRCASQRDHANPVHYLYRGHHVTVTVTERCLDRDHLGIDATTPQRKTHRVVVRWWAKPPPY